MKKLLKLLKFGSLRLLELKNSMISKKLLPEQLHRHLISSLTELQHKFGTKMTLENPTNYFKILWIRKLWQVLLCQNMMPYLNSDRL